MNKQNNQEYQECKEFFEFIFQQDIELKHEENLGRIVYYPTNIEPVWNSKVFKRMERILQNGTGIYEIPTFTETRRRHSIGTYYRTLNVLKRIYKNPELKGTLDEESYRKYLLAILMKSLLHDIGHGPFSHSLETVCDWGHGYHEEIGNYIIKEYMKNDIDKVYPGLSDAMKMIEEKNPLGLNILLDGPLDVDRGDFIPSGNKCLGIYKNDNVEKSVSQMFDSILIDKINPLDKDTKSNTEKVTLLYPEEQIPNIENFLRNRYRNYKFGYVEPNSRAIEYLFKIFGEKLLSVQDENYKLKDFLQQMKNIKQKPVDKKRAIESLIEFDEIEYLDGIADVIENTHDEELRKLALMSLPSIQTLASMYKHLKESRKKELGNGAEVTEQDAKVIKRLYDLNEKYKQPPKSKDPNRYFNQNCLIAGLRMKENVETLQKVLKQELQLSIEEENLEKELEKYGIITWRYPIKMYDGGIFIKRENGTICDFKDCPSRKEPLIEEELIGIFLVIPELEKMGISKQEIEKIKCIFKNARQVVHEVR